MPRTDSFAFGFMGTLQNLGQNMEHNNLLDSCNSTWRSSFEIACTDRFWLPDDAYGRTCWNWLNVPIHWFLQCQGSPKHPDKIQTRTTEKLVNPISSHPGDSSISILLLFCVWQSKNWKQGGHEVVTDCNDCTYNLQSITNLPTSLDFYNMKVYIDIAEGIKYLLHNKAV